MRGISAIMWAKCHGSQTVAPFLTVVKNSGYGLGDAVVCPVAKKPFDLSISPPLVRLTSEAPLSC